MPTIDAVASYLTRRGESRIRVTVDTNSGRGHQDLLVAFANRNLKIGSRFQDYFRGRLTTYTIDDIRSDEIK